MKPKLSPWLGCVLLALLLCALPLVGAGFSAGRFEGQHYHGQGDVEYFQLLERARRMFEPDPEFQNLTMLYEPKWNGLVEGPTWDAWWIQNSYGTTYAILPFLREPWVSFLQHSQDLWFDQMGDGHRVGAGAPFDWVAPDGCLCDAARPGWIVYKQGDGQTALHDWGMEFTAAGLLLQSELLLISRDAQAIGHYLPKLERCAAFIETRRDPTNNLFLAGPAANLLAPSYAGWHRPDGSYGQAYLTGLSITYLAALDRLIELEKFAGRPDQAARYEALCHTAKEALGLLTAPEGYFIRSLDPDGTRHGVVGAPRFGYFEASPNHDAIAFRIVDDRPAENIYHQILRLPGLRPYDFVLPNFPSYDDLYEKPEGLWAYGTWVNGGHWSTCEARMVLAYYRLGQYEDARRSLRRLFTFADRFRLDNPLTHCGSEVYQPHEPINLCYDSFGPAAAFMRGLFEYLYHADSLTLIPHIPSGIEQLEQLDPVRWGQKRIYLSTVGQGPIARVLINGRKWRQFSPGAVFLPFAQTPAVARVEIVLGEGHLPAGQAHAEAAGRWSPGDLSAGVAELRPWEARLAGFRDRLTHAGLGQTYAAAHAQLALDSIAAVGQRQHLQHNGQLAPLPGPTKKAADAAFISAATKLCDGLEKVLRTYAASTNATEQRISQLWPGEQPAANLSTGR